MQKKSPFMFLRRLVVLGALTAGSIEANASSSFSGSADLAFNYAGDMAGILVALNGNYVDDGSLLVGDATSVEALSFPNPDAGSFSVSGSVNDSQGGQAHSSHIASYDLTFTNESADVRSFTLSLDYVLHAVVTGEYANSVVQISFGDSGYDEVTAYLFDAMNDVGITASSGQIAFNLGAGAIQNFNVTVGVVGDYAGTTPVPLPAAAWLFLAGMFGMLGIEKRKSRVAA